MALSSGRKSDDVIAGRDRDQMGWPHNRSQPLRRSDIGEAVHADLAIGAGQGRRPLDTVVAILHLVLEGVERPLRSVLSSHVLDRDDVALGRIKIRATHTREICAVLLLYGSRMSRTE